MAFHRTVARIFFSPLREIQFTRACVEGFVPKAQDALSPAFHTKLGQREDIVITLYESIIR